MALKHLKSEFAPASKEAIESAKIWLLRAAGPDYYGGEQFGAASFTEKGRMWGDYWRMCSGSLTTDNNHFNQNLLAVRYLGEANGGTHSNRTVRYDDANPDAPGRVWLRYLLSDESPYLDIFPYLVSRDPEEVYAQRGFMFQNMDAMPIGVWKSFVIAQRFVGEMSNHYTVWKRLVDRGCNPRAAHLLATVYHIPNAEDSLDFLWPTGDPFPDRIYSKDRIYFYPSWSHMAFNNPVACLGAIQQNYHYQTSSCASGKVIESDYPQSNGYSGGFMVQGWTAQSPNCQSGEKLYFDPTMSGLNAAGYLEQGPSRATIDDLVNQATLLTLMATGAMDFTQGRKLMTELWVSVQERSRAPMKAQAKRSTISFDEEAA